MTRLCLAAALALGAGIALMGAARGEAVWGVNGDTGLSFWHWRSDSVSVELVQRLPDQTRAFFLGRGFSAEAADAIGLGCVFQTIFKNTAPKGASTTLEYHLGDWRVRTEGQTRPPKLKEVWDQQWKEMGVSQAARIAFRWSLLPTSQRFDAGDYNWGMTSFGLAPGTRFDLDLVWHRDGKRETGRLANVECPRDLQL